MLLLVDSAVTCCCGFAYVQCVKWIEEARLLFLGHLTVYYMSCGLNIALHFRPIR